MINDVKLIDLQAHIDDRGYLIEIAQSVESEKPHGVVHRFGQVYLVGDPTRHTIRAFHKHAELWDWFFMSRGTAKFVLKDDRNTSSTYNEVTTVVLSERSPQLLVVPPGVYHGWMSLCDDTQMISTASHVYNSEHPDEVRIPFDAFGDVWTVKGR